MAGTIDSNETLGEQLVKGIHVDTDEVRFLRHDVAIAVDQIVALGEAGLTVIRWIGETYYDHQLYRLESDSRIREAEKLKLPAALLAWYSDQQSRIEKTMLAILAKYTDVEPTGMGKYARNVTGIGPIISAMLLALIDMNIATNPSKIYRYFGLDPTSKWLGREKAETALRIVMEETKSSTINDALVRAVALTLGRNQETLLRQAYSKDGNLTRASLVSAIAKRPWNATAKTLAWKIGDSFVKFHNHPKCFYGKIYEQEKALQQQRNLSGANAEFCRHELAERIFRDRETRQLYESGRIPEGRIELRARRKATKVFLTHWWAEAYRRKYKREAPRIWALEHGGHTTEIRDPQLSDSLLKR